MRSTSGLLRLQRTRFFFAHPKEFASAVLGNEMFEQKQLVVASGI
jgi:hypothetical protein